MLNVNSNGYLYSIGGKVEQWYMDQSFWKWHWYVMTDERNSEILWNRLKSYIKKAEEICTMFCRQKPEGQQSHFFMNKNHLSIIQSSAFQSRSKGWMHGPRGNTLFLKLHQSVILTNYVQQKWLIFDIPVDMISNQSYPLGWI